MSDNFHFDLTGVSIEKALEIAFQQHSKAVAWAVVPLKEGSERTRLILFWTNHSEATPLPAPMDCAAAVPFVKSWLSAADYGREPDHDGDNGKGCRIYNEAWTHINGMWQAFVAIEPVWLEYGK